MKLDVMGPGGGESAFHLVQGWESKVAAFVTAPPRVYPCSFSWTLSRLLLSSEAVNPLWPSGHEAEYNHWPQTSSCGCNHYLRAWPSLRLPADRPNPSEHSFSSVPRGLSAPSAMAPAQEGCSLCSVCSVESSEADLHVDRLLCDSQPCNLTELAECPWTWMQGEAVRASLQASHSGSDPGQLSALGHISLPLGASVSSSVKWRW